MEQAFCVVERTVDRGTTLLQCKIYGRAARRTSPLMCIRAKLYYGLDGRWAHRIGTRCLASTDVAPVSVRVGVPSTFVFGDALIFGFVWCRKIGGAGLGAQP